MTMDLKTVRTGTKDSDKAMFLKITSNTIEHPDHIAEIMLNGVIFFRSLGQYDAKEQFVKRWNES